ncbi:MAG TPA: amino acid adenylation domain-containing protein, partial [Ktedonobacteraceae bacterium]|nr:amino acid adenylation domain-containing protein [Ktedonobacteraceae bacterium]
MDQASRRSFELSQKKRVLLGRLLQQEGVEVTPSQKKLRRRQRTGPLPLSFTQQRFWFLDQWDPNSPVYTIARQIVLSGHVNEAALEQSLNEIVRRHEALRTTFALADERPVQIIAPTLVVKPLRVDLTALPAAEQGNQVQRLANELARQPFNLAEGPLLRVHLLRLDQEKHVLLLAVHHIICDGWSLAILLHEFVTLYAAFSAKQPSPLPVPSMQYADFALWQREWLQGDTLKRQLAYWKQQLGNAPALLDLPTDHLRPVVQTYQGNHYHFSLLPVLKDALLTLSQQEDATLFMTLLAAFAVLLFRYSGQCDLVIGTPIANRRQTELEGLIGSFANTLALRLSLSSSLSFRQFLQRVRAVCLDAYTYQDLPFEKLVEELAPERSLSHAPLFQTMFALQHASSFPVMLPELTINNPLQIGTGTARMDLMLTVIDTEPGLEANFEYSTDLFERATIQRMAEHWQHLLASIVVAPEQPLAGLELLDETEREQLLISWNATQLPYKYAACIHDLFEAQAAHTPDAIALVSGESLLTYLELDQRANQVAHYLRQLNVGPEIIVGLCMERSPEMVIGLLAIFKAGGAYVPLDPGYPQVRLGWIIQDSRVAVVLTQEALQAKLAEVSQYVQLISLDRDIPARHEGAREASPQSTVRPENLAYVIYTSGSTGRPKGVAIAHRSVVALLAWAHNVFTPEQYSGVLASTSICFDLSAFELWLPLCHGGSVILSENALQLQELPAVGKITLLNTVPSVLTELLRTGSLPASIKTVTLAGEPLPAALVQRLYASGSIEQVYNLYGPTEDTTYSTWALVQRAPGSVVSIGRPIANTQAYLLDESLRPVPIGVYGELYLSGEGLARGYLHRPDLTAECFIPHPFSSTPGARLYRTGDIARYLPCEGIEFVGRRDGQVKMRGFRIELGEIEAVLREHPLVCDAVVLIREDHPGRQSLVAYVVLQSSLTSQAPGGDLQSWLKARLPDYMIPAIFLQLDHLPLMPNGKIDRFALPAPLYGRSELAPISIAPGTPIEELLLNNWKDVLGNEQIGIQDNFFELGGHSLLATRVVARIRATLQVDLPLRAIFEAPTIQGLARHIAAMDFAKLDHSVPSLAPGRRSDYLPLSFAQQRLWFLDQLVPERPLYNLSTSLRLTGVLNLAALEESLKEIVRRHEVLRTIFTQVDGQPVQVIVPEQIVPLAVIDLSQHSLVEREQVVQQLASEVVNRPLSLTRGPLIHALLFRLDSADAILLLIIHHIVCDGWSLDILHRELITLYESFSAGQSSPLPPLQLQYADFAIWQREWLQGNLLDRQLAYWKRQLESAPVLLDLPTDYPRPSIQTFEGRRHRFVLSSELTRGLIALSRQENTTLFMTLLASFVSLLFRYSNQSDIVIGTPIANRQQAKLEDLVGVFANTLALRIQPSGVISFQQLLRQVREVCLGAYMHQDLPFEKLVEELATERSLSHTPLFQVVFMLQNAVTPLSEQRLSALRPFEINSNVTKFDLTLAVTETQQGLICLWEYNTALFEADTIQRMAEHWQRLLESVVMEPWRSIGDLPLLSQAEQEQLLRTWNPPAAPLELPAGGVGVHEHFAAQARHTPDAIA